MVRRRGISIPTFRFPRPRPLHRIWQMQVPLVLAPTPSQTQITSTHRLLLLKNHHRPKSRTNPAPPSLIHLYTPTHPPTLSTCIYNRRSRCSRFRSLECRFRCLLERGRFLVRVEELLGLPLVRHLGLVKLLRVRI